MELDRGGLGRWVPADAGDTLCVGDLVRVQAFARAALRLPDDTVLRLDQNTTMRWTAPESQDRSLLELLRGIIHVISATMTAVLNTMLRSYVTALMIITPLMVMLIGRLGVGLLAMIPNLAPVALTVGIMARTSRSCQ